MNYYEELKYDALGEEKVGEGRIIAQSEVDGRMYGYHSSFSEGFTRLRSIINIPPWYMQEFTRPVSKEEARAIMPDLFAWLEKYGITDISKGTYREPRQSKEEEEVLDGRQ